MWDIGTSIRKVHGLGAC